VDINAAVYSEIKTDLIRHETLYCHIFSETYIESNHVINHSLPFGGIELEQNRNNAFSGANLIRLRIT